MLTPALYGSQIEQLYQYWFTLQKHAAIAVHNFEKQTYSHAIFDENWFVTLIPKE